MSSAILFAGLLSLAQTSGVPAEQPTEKQEIRLALAEGSVLDPSKALYADTVIVDDDDDDDDVVTTPPPAPPPAEPTKEVDVHTNVEAESPGNWMGTLAVSALAGGLVGALVGTSIYLLERPDAEAINIGYWTGGGILLGVGVGAIQIALQEDRVDDALEARVLDDSPAPKVVGITLPF